MSELSKINFIPKEKLYASQLNIIAKNSNIPFVKLAAGEYLPIFSDQPTPVFIEDVDYQPIADSIFIQDINTPTSYTMGYYSGASGGRQIGQPFNSGNCNRLNKITLRMNKQGSPTGNFYVRVYACDSNKFPTGSVLKEFIVDAATISASATEYEYNCAGLVISQNTNYIVMVEFDSMSANSSNYIVFSISVPNSTDYLKRRDYSNNWITDSNYSCYFKINGERVLSETEKRTAGKIYLSEADHSYKNKFDGFIFSAANKDDEAVVHLQGNADGFAGLLPGKLYYIQNYFKKTQSKETNNGGRTIGYYSVSGVGVSFLTSANDRKLKKVSLLFFKNSSGSSSAPITVNIYLADANGRPTGSSLGSKAITYDDLNYAQWVWKDFQFTSPIEVSPNTRYVITVNYTGSGYEMNWAYQTESSGGGGMYWNGSSWVLEATRNYCFQLYSTAGDAIAVSKGDAEISVGSALSATELKIEKRQGEILASFSAGEVSTTQLSERVNKVLVSFMGVIYNTPWFTEYEIKPGQSKGFAYNNYGFSASLSASRVLTLSRNGQSYAVVNGSVNVICLS